MIERILARLTINAAIIALLVGALVVQTVRIEGFKIWPLSIAGLKAQNQSLRTQIVANKQAYEQAQKDAAQQNQAEVKRIEAEQERISREVQSDLTARLERLRRELRAKTAEGSSGPAGSSANGPSASGTADPSRVCFAPEELLRGAENEERHEQLIRWVERQLEVKR